MANKFKVWIDVANNNILSEADYAEDAQRTNGFTTGTVASSKRVNSALRSSSLVTAALMGLVDNDNIDLTSSLSDVQQALASYFTRVGSVTPDASVADNIVKFNVGNSTYNKTINNVANVTDSLNNIPLIGTNGIFENNGKKAKNATQADNANKVENIDFSEDSIASFGSYTIPKRKLLWSGSVQLNDKTTTFKEIFTGDLLNKKIEVLINQQYFEFKVENNITIGGNRFQVNFPNKIGTATYVANGIFYFCEITLKFENGVLSGTALVYLMKSDSSYELLDVAHGYGAVIKELYEITE